MERRLRDRYQKIAVPALLEAFQYKNKHEIPLVDRVVVNVGLSSGRKDDKYKETVQNTLQRITGQKPLLTRAKRSIASFNIRKGMVVGAKVTLRGKRMEDFLDKLISITLPRVRDFQGVSPENFGQSGTLTVGFREHTVFPEIRSDEVEHLHGLEVSIVTTAKTPKEGQVLLKQLGFPFRAPGALASTDMQRPSAKKNMYDKRPLTIHP